jgi:hypothetical protein
MLQLIPTNTLQCCGCEATENGIRMRGGSVLARTVRISTCDLELLGSV